MNLKKFGLKVLSVAIAVVMLVSVCAPAILATTEYVEENNKEINYVSIGDSMTNGYGFVGYNQDQHVAEYDFFNDVNVYGEGSYALQFENWLEEQGNTVNHTKLALSGLRAEDMLYLLGITDSAPADGYFSTCWSYAWNNTPFEPGTSEGWTNYNVNKDDPAKKDDIAAQTVQMQQYYQDSLKNADVISIALGNASFNAYFIDRAMRIFGAMGQGFEPEYGINQMTLEDALAMMENEREKQLVREVYSALMIELLAAIPADAAEQFKVEELCDLAAYITASFALSYKGVIEWIAENNSDAEVVLVGVLNSNAGMTVSGFGGEFDLGGTMGKIYDAVSAYIAALPTVMQLNGQTQDVKFYFAEQPSNPEMVAAVVGELAEANWTTVDRVDGATVKHKTESAYYEIVAPMLEQGFGALPVEAHAVVYKGLEIAIVESLKSSEIEMDAVATFVGGMESVFTGAPADVLTSYISGLYYGAPGAATEDEAVAAFAEFFCDEEMLPLVRLFAMNKVGNGISAHPTPVTHDRIAASVINAYKNGYTAKDETVKNALELLSVLSKFVAEYYDEAYEYGYGYADENGYIDAAQAAIDEAIAAIEALEIEDGVMSAELKAALEAELAEVVKTLTEIKAALASDKAATVEGLVATIAALEDDLYAHLANVETILEQAGIDAYEYLYPIVMEQIEIIKTEVIPAILEAVEMAAEKAYNYLVVKVGEIMGIMLDLKATVEENLEILREQLAEIYGIIIDVNTTVEEIIAAIRNHIAKITMGEYTVSDDSYYVAIDGEGYADILADALNLTPDQFNAVAWDEVTFEEIAKADFITVGYDDSSVVAFTTEQFLGYAKAYLDGTFRTDVESYIDDALSAIFAADVMAEIKDGVNSAIDSVVASEMLADKEVVALDWAALVGAENVARIDEIRADIKASLVNAGVPAVAEIEINVVETLYEYGFNAFTKEFLYNNLGENAYYTVEIPVLDLAVFTAESALYENVRYNANYSQTILAINKINPDATVAVLGNYDIFDGISLGIDKITGETTIPVTELLGLEEIPGIIEAIVAQIPAGDDLVLELGDLADMEVYEVEIPVAELVDFAVEKYNALVSYVETVEIPVTNENVALLLDYAKKTWAEVEPEYNAFVADVMAKLEKASEMGVYTVEIPVGAIIDYAVDTYDYLVDLFALLADVDYTVDDVTVSVTVDLAGAYEALVELSSIHPLAYAVIFENVFFVDVSDVETNFEAIVADGDILTYILCCIDNIEMIAPSAAGNEYIAEQILKALVVTCDHVYDDCADVDCNRCGELREAPGHTSDTDCDVCGYHAHANGVKQNGQAATCTVDGWNDYYVCSCGKFFADAACTEEIADLEAWKVGAGKIVAAHNYGDLVPAVDEKHTATELVAGVAAHYQCSVCETYFTADKVETTLEALTGATPSHVFGSWITDEEKHWKECSCGLKTEEGAHVDADNDDKCDTCAKALATGPDSGTTLPAHTHSFGDWVTDDQNHWKVCSCGEKSELGEHKDADNDGKCDVCKADMTSEDSEEGLSTGATVAIVVGSSVVVAIGGFSLVWFVFCKKSWLDLVAIFKR